MVASLIHSDAVVLHFALRPRVVEHTAFARQGEISSLLTPIKGMLDRQKLLQQEFSDRFHGEVAAHADIVGIGIEGLDDAQNPRHECPVYLRCSVVHTCHATL